MISTFDRSARQDPASDRLAFPPGVVETEPTRPGELPNGWGVPPQGYESFLGRPSWRVLIGALVLCVATTLLGAEGAVVVEFLKDEEWEAVSQMEFRDPFLLPETVSVTLESPSIWHPVAEAEGIGDEEFQKHYDSSVAGGTQIITVSYIDSDPQRARRITDGVVANYIDRFSASPIEDQTEVLTEYISSLRELETSIEESLDGRDRLSTASQIDLQDQLVRTRQQINDLTLRVVRQEDSEQIRANTDPRVVTSGFVLDEPVTPAPLRAAVFGAGAGGMVGLLLSYLAFHRTALPADGADPWGGTGSARRRRRRPGPAGSGANRLPVTVGSRPSLVLKRVVDILVALVVMMATWPLLLVVAIMVKISSQGPVLFRQERVGLLGEPFEIVKFRTMRVDNDDSTHRAHVERQILDSGDRQDGGSFKLADPRVTSVGRLLRRLSIDELPQMWNVLRGDMSLVGPRPALAWEHQLFDPRYHDRVLAAPGCSGLWQVSGRSTLSMGEMLELDLDYVRNWSLWRDLWILFKTPLALVRGDGAR